MLYYTLFKAMKQEKTALNIQDCFLAIPLLFYYSSNSEIAIFFLSGLSTSPEIKQISA